MKKPEALPEDQNSGLKFNVSCKTTSGKEIKSTDKGYDDCMHTTATKANQEMMEKQKKKSF